MKEVEKVQIIEFQERYSKEFADLNYEWIEKGYSVEDHDRELLDHPLEKIIHTGGQIFFAVTRETPVGTVALISTEDSTFELAKMAVSPEFRGRGISNLLMTACIKYSTLAGKSKIILESNTKQAAAIELYRKFGFIETPLDPNSLFMRANIRMELLI